MTTAPSSSSASDASTVAFPVLSYENMTSLCVPIGTCPQFGLRQDDDVFNIVNGNNYRNSMTYIYDESLDGKHFMIDKLRDMNRDAILKYGGDICLISAYDYNPKNRQCFVFSPEFGKYSCDVKLSRNGEYLIFPDGSKYRHSYCYVVSIHRKTVKDAVVIETEDPTVVRQETVCPVCMEDYPEDENKIFCSNGHRVCYQCYRKTEKKDECVTCRAIVLAKTVNVVSFQKLSIYDGVDNRKLFINCLRRTLRHMNLHTHKIYATALADELQHFIKLQSYWDFLECRENAYVFRIDDIKNNQDLFDAIIAKINDDNFKKIIHKLYAGNEMRDVEVIEYLENKYGDKNTLMLLKAYSGNKRKDLEHYVDVESRFEILRRLSKEEHYGILSTVFTHIFNNLRHLNEYGW
jgi:hypothetical protein